MFSVGIFLEGCRRQKQKYKSEMHEEERTRAGCRGAVREAETVTARKPCSDGVGKPAWKVLLGGLLSGSENSLIFFILCTLSE